MATMAKALLSANATGNPISLGTSGAKTEVHAGSSSDAGHIDLVTLYLYNSNTSAETAVIEISGTGQPLKFVINPEETILALDGVPVGGVASGTANKLNGYSDTTAKVFAYGSVTTIR